MYISGYYLEVIYLDFQKAFDKAGIAYKADS